MITEHSEIMRCRRQGALWVGIDHDDILLGFPTKKPLPDVKLGNALDRYWFLFKRRKFLKHAYREASKDVEDFAWRMA